jgi:TrmH family RNA methyltransferase
MSNYPLSRARAKRLRTLHARRHREESGLFLAEGVRLVEELVASPLGIDSAVVAPSLEDTPRGRALLDRLRARAPIETATESELRELAETESPQGVVVVACIPRHSLPATLGGRALVLVLDAVQDPGNFGTLIRGADAFGASVVVALPGTVDPWNGKAVRSAAGSSFRVPVVASSAAVLRDWADAHAVRIWGADAAGADVALEPVPERVALVLGNEGAGLTAGSRAIVERSVSIPIRGAAESLNVAMAGTVLMYLLTASR